MPFGSGDYTYEIVEGWGQLPEGWTWGVIPAVACDSQDRVFVYSRSEHPLVIFDRDGNFLDSWDPETRRMAGDNFDDRALLAVMAAKLNRAESERDEIRSRLYALEAVVAAL